MKCILISEEDHGTIGVAADYKSALKWLIKVEEINDYIELYNSNDDLVFLKDIMPNWRTNLFTFSIDELKDFFDGMFYFTEVEFYSAAD